jgi:hypothetical protein
VILATSRAKPVRTKLLRELDRLFNNTGQRSFDIHNYTGQALDVAFEINTVDTFIAGIASRIIDQERITRTHRKILNEERLSGTDWRCFDGVLFSLKEYPELYTAASGVEELRLKARQALCNLN